MVGAHLVEMIAELTINRAGDDDDGVAIVFSEKRPREQIRPDHPLDAASHEANVGGTVISSAVDTLQQLSKKAERRDDPLPHSSNAISASRG